MQSLIKTSSDFSLIFTLNLAQGFYSALAQNDEPAAREIAADIFPHLFNVLSAADALATRMAAFFPFLRAFVPTFLEAVRVLDEESGAFVDAVQKASRTFQALCVHADAIPVAHSNLCPLCSQSISRPSHSS